MIDRTERRNNLDLRVGARSKCIEFQGSMLNFVSCYLLHFSSKLTFLVCRDTWHQISRTGFWLCGCLAFEIRCVFFSDAVRVEG